MKKNSFKNALKALRVRYWYEGVRIDLNAPSAYALEKIFEPIKVGLDGFVMAMAKKWPRYNRGEVVPSAKILSKVEARLPGSSKSLHHPLWVVLAAEKITFRQMPKYIDMLEPDVKVRLHKWLRVKKVGDLNYFWPGKGDVFVANENLDVLAGLLMVWMAYQHEGNHNAACILANSIYRSMLISGEKFEQRGLAAEFYEIFYSKVFSNTNWENGRFGLKVSNFISDLESMREMLFYIDLYWQQFSPKDICWLKQKLMFGHFGMSCLHGFSILILPNWKNGPPTRSEYYSRQLRTLCWRWGQAHFMRGSIGRVHQDMLWKKLEKEFLG